jgi:hypothetical protein
VTDVADIVVDGEIAIGPELWAVLRRDVEGTTALIESAVDDLGVPYPVKVPSEAEAVADFRRLHGRRSAPLGQGKWFSPFKYAVPMTEKFVDIDLTGMKASDFFHSHARHACNVRGYPSPLRTWADSRLRQGLLKALWTLKCQKVTSSELRRAMSMRKAIAAQFRPAAARDLFARYEARRVLDFCAGWGDRLVAAIADERIESYTGVDPNTALHQGYRRQVEMFAPLRSAPIDVTMICAPAEEMVLTQTYDMVFTSPPYFDKERYTDEGTQSWMRYRAVSEWLRRFLFEAVARAWAALVPGGHMVINIADILSKRRLPNGTRDVERLCDPLCEFVAGLPGSSLVEAVGLRIPGRPQVAHVARCEPMWVWRKDRPF